MKCSFGVASCARMSSARIPPATKNARLVAMYMIPIRLWSTVVSQLETRPRARMTETAGDSALAAMEPPLQIRDERVQLPVAPGPADRGHPVAPVAHEQRQRVAVGEDRALRDRRPDVTLAREPVAGGAYALEGLAADLRGRMRPSVPPGVVGLGLHHLDVGDHRRMLDPAELRALAAEGAELDRPPRLAVGLAGDRVELAAHRRHVPAVRHVRGADLERRPAPHWEAQRVDRDRAVRINELPVELVSLDPDRRTPALLRRDSYSPHLAA